MSLSPYLMNVALHAAAISLFAMVLLPVFRKATRRAAIALTGLVAVLVLPWLTPLRPDPVARTGERAGPVRALPVWHVVTLSSREAGELAVRQAEPVRTAFQLPPARTIAAWIWVSGSAAGALALLLATVRMGLWRRMLVAPDEVAWTRLATACPAELRRSVLRLSMEDRSPCVAGILNPVIVMPRALLDLEGNRRLRWALLHEHRHWLGHDSRWTALVMLVRAVFWWNPLVHLLASHWAAARERICDLHATQDDRDAYGEFLVEMASSAGSTRMLAAPMIRRSPVRRLRARILSLLQAAPGEGTATGRAFLLTAGGSLMIAAVLSSGMKVAEGNGQSFTLIANAGAAEPVPVSPQAGDRGAFIKFNTKIIFSRKEGPANGTVLTADELNALMRKEAQTAGTMLITARSDVVRTPEEHHVELGLNNPDHPEDSLDAAGWQIRLTPRYDGERFALNSMVRYAFVPGKQFSPAAAGRSERIEGKDIVWKDLVVKNGRAEGILSPADTLVTALGEADGWYGMVLTSVEPVDIHEKPVDDFEKAVRDRLANREGVVEIEGYYLEDTFQNEFPKLPADRWKYLQANPDSVKLPLVKLGTGEDQVVWPALKDLKVRAQLFQGSDNADLDLCYPDLEDDGRIARRRFPQMASGEIQVVEMNFGGNTRKLLALKIKIPE